MNRKILALALAALLLALSWAAAEAPAPRAEIKTGDILCFGYGPYSISHVGIYIGNGQMVHASTYTTGVIISDFDSTYYTNNFVGAKRVV